MDWLRPRIELLVALPARPRRQAPRGRLQLGHLGGRGRRPRGGRGAGCRGADRGRSRGRDRGRDHRRRAGSACSPRRPRSSDGAYRRALESRAAGEQLQVVEVAAPDLAPIIQNGFPFDERVIDTVRSYCAPLKRARGRHPDPRLHALPARGPDAAADAGPRRAPGHRRPRGGRRRAARPRGVGGWRRGAPAKGTTASCAPATWTRSASSAPASCRCRSARSSGSSSAPRWRAAAAGRDPHRPSPPGYPVAVSILEQVQADTREAMKAGERDRVGALRMLASALQQDAKLGDDDEVGVLQRERKKRLEAAEAFRKGGSEERAATEELGGAADRGLPAGPALRRGARRAGRGRDRGGRGVGPGRDGQGDVAGDAAGRRACRRQAGQCGGARAAGRLARDRDWLAGS